MASEHELKTVRQGKADALRARGVNPYPASTKRTHSLKHVCKEFETLQNTGESVTVAGRVMIMRGQGAISFIKLLDGTGEFQAVLKKDEVSQEVFESFKDSVDMADIIEITGTVFVTKRGQQSILIQDWKMLTKALLPLPDKFHGMVDEDLRYRKRYLDILTNPEVKELLIKKAQFWASMRNFLTQKGFLEVETPTLEVTTGGAEATPFKTHHNDFDIDVFLRISVGELWQKRLMAAGFDKTFEIGRVYRNEGSSPNHLQEFTNMEFYWSYADYKDGMDLVKEMYRTIAQEVFGATKFNVRGYEFDFADEWEELDYQNVIKEKTGIDILTATSEEMMQKLQELGVEYDKKKAQQGRLVDTLWKYCRKQIAGPAFLVNIPKLVSPLAKEDPERPGITQRFQPIIAGTEVGNGFSELNDPVDQRRRFEEQQELLKAGDSEAMMPEWEFVEMLEHGMPPAFGFGAGERLFAILADKPIREAVWFPLMKPKHEQVKIQH